ncbi:Putative Haemagglutination activity domain protein [Planktothrix tepida]|uniref:Haemagglutination activity domain protein n=1 Tax=Planktothrix pseudagardhii TaxID=132604 RepID=A0A9W4CDG7_9CYAN|nr:Putative Haemagglutination activity domain protein [Planktothrix pseudagardhii]CAD5911943.1 Putative Haemagglutination activity domain protein [Planktothrix tepida]
MTEQATQTLLQPVPRVWIQPDSVVENLPTIQGAEVLVIEPSIDTRINDEFSELGGGLVVQVNADNQLTLENPSVNNPNLVETSIKNLRLGINQSFDSNNVETAISQIEELVNLEYLNYLGKPASITQLTVKEMQYQLRSMQAQTGKESALIYVYSRPEGLELVVVTKNTIVHKTVPEAIPEKLFATTRNFVKEITSPRQRDTTSYLPPAQQLYQWMIAPLEATLKANKVDIIMLTLDSGLRSLPLAALHDGSQFLIEKYGLSLIPSFSSLDTRYRSISQADVLAMGASIFQDQDFLPSVPVEVETIAEQRAQGEYFLNEKFTLENLKQQYKMQPSPIVHLATHADFRAGSPANSFIQLWDTKLTLDQMEQMGWSRPTADLLTLSACRTAIGDDQAELGFAGLAIASGAKSALASLWYISDAGTLALMTGFYHHLTETTTKAEALQKAQISLLRGTAVFEPEHLFLSEEKIKVSLPPELRNLDDFSLVHPYYWASFTLIGSPL